MTTFAPAGRAAGLLCALAALALAGCGGGPKVVPVTGKAFYRDQPFAGTVCLFPDSPDALPAEAAAGPDGSFAFKTFHGDGAAAGGVVPGKYKVGIRAQVKGQNPALVKYTAAKSTPLAVDVPPEGLSGYEIRLK